MRGKATIFLVAAWAAVVMMAGGFVTPGAMSAMAQARKGWQPADGPAFDAVWVHEGNTSAVVYWHLGDISKEASDSTVEYGETAAYGKKTEMVKPATTTRVRNPNTRWAHLHWITGLEPGKTYHYRMVMTLDGKEVKSKDMTFETGTFADAVKLRGNADGATIRLDKADTTYVLTEDVKANGTAFEIVADGITLDLDGHTVDFSQNSNKRVYGVSCPASRAKIVNGFLRQGSRGAKYSAAVYLAKGRDVEVAGIYTDVGVACAYPLRSLRTGGKVDVHHNHFYSRVTDIDSRHYPGNDIIQIAPDRENSRISVHHNLLTEGCHRAIYIVGNPRHTSDVYANDIRHHQQYVNGHAFFFYRAGNAKVHHNHVTSSGRGMQIGGDMEIYSNWFDIQGHVQKSDMPQGTRPWRPRRVELHGFKFEGKYCRNVKLHDNFIRITQHQPNDRWDYVPATPLNWSGIDRNAMNEVWNNTIVAITTYKKTRHGGYGKSGQWASAIFIASMKTADSDRGKYGVYIHDNEFTSNDLFISGRVSGNAVRIEKNTFTLGENPTEGHAVFRGIPADIQERIKDSGNTFEGMKP